MIPPFRQSGLLGGAVQDGGCPSKALKARLGCCESNGFDRKKKHGFIDRKRGMEVFRTMNPDAPLIVAEAFGNTASISCQAGTHRGLSPTVAN